MIELIHELVIHVDDHTALLGIDSNLQPSPARIGYGSDSLEAKRVDVLLGQSLDQYGLQFLDICIDTGVDGRLEDVVLEP
ncbi:hypothetical protein [Halorussus sp. AFM4]|uniref:hypothetical protein n=1 Tax=Halorussus sp. AFM4 TaxID=3421651 RepID=UPI003EBFF2F2